MYITTLKNDDSTYEIYFDGLASWDDLDLILKKLVSENQCTVVEVIDMISDKDVILKSGEISFTLRHHYIFGNYIYFTNEKDIDFLEKLARNVVESIKLWLKGIQQETLDRFNQETNIKEKALLFSEYGNIVGLSKDIQGYYFMMDYIRDSVENSDSESLLRNINAVLNQLNVVSQKEQKKEIIMEMLELLKYLVANPISISDDYRVNGELGDSLSEETILSNIKRAIKYWEEELKRLKRKKFWSFKK